MGNVKTLVQHSKMLVAADNANGEKRIDYQYDLISGKVNKVIYQPGKGDQFIHWYNYDADNRIISVNTSRDGLVWQNDAKYVYHLHGPLARTELGDLKVQGLDYAYTLQGWLKGVNSSSLGDPQFDMGQDGKTGGTMPIVARDAFGYMLDYYRGDYKPIGQQQYSINSFNGPAAVAATGFRDLFNGNIGGMLTNIRQLNEPMYYRYGYDQLNRIKSMDAFRGQDAAANTWTAPLSTTDYQERVTYDPNGNIKTYLRNGKTTTAMDNLEYNYTPNTNKLRQVMDAVADGNYTEDIDGQPLVDNYTYDRIGNMKTDNAGGIASVIWTVYGKIKRIAKSNNDVIEFGYDASGSRTSKAVTAGSTITTTYYVRDAQGNVMAVYEQQAANPLKWTEQHLYGNSRLGIWTFGETIPGAATIPTGSGSLEDGYTYGKKMFELSNHLGNVLTTISDRKLGVDGDGNGNTDYFLPEVLNAQDYYPGGMTMPGRKYGLAFVHGFNGMTQSSEIYGEGRSYSAEYWEYDSRIVRRWNLDPVIKDYESPYMCFSGNPIFFNDPDGDSPGKPKSNGSDEGQVAYTTEEKYMSTGMGYGSSYQVSTKWIWHKGGVLQNNGKVSEAGWYDQSGYARVLSPIAADLAGYQGLYSPAAGNNWSEDEKNNVSNTRLGKFVGDGVSETTANVLASTAQSYARFRNFQVSGVTYQSGFNVEDILGIGLIAKQLMKGLGTSLLRKLPQGGLSFSEYKAIRGGTETLDFIRTTNKQGQVVFQRISTEFHHAFITQKTQKAMGLPNWMVNNRFNVWKLNTIQHSIIDPARKQFLRAGLKDQIGFFGNMEYNWFTKFPSGR